MKEKETLDTLEAINGNLKSGILVLVAIASQIRDGKKDKPPSPAEMENAAETLRRSASILGLGDF